MSYFQLKIDIFHSLTPHLSCKLVREEVGGGGGGESGGEGGRGCFCLLLRRIRFVYNFVRLTLISHDF